MSVYDNPSREDLPAYREYAAAIERLAAEIDEEFSTDEWTSVVLEIVDDYPAALAALRRSDVVFVNSVRDGMNLVVLEAIVLSEHDPAVVISREMGAAEVLGDDAIAINPFDVSASADALHAALLLERARARRTDRADADRGPAAAAGQVVPGAAGRVARWLAPRSAEQRFEQRHRIGGAARDASAASTASATPDERTATPQAVRPDARKARSSPNAGTSPRSSPTYRTAPCSPLSRRMTPALS